MEKSYIGLMNENYLKEIGFTKEDITRITTYIQTGIEKHLYTDTKDFNHDIKHIERVLAYVEWILKEKKNHGETLEQENLLRVVALYHDIGKTIGAEEKSHGIIGAKKAKEKLEPELSPKELEIVSLLIETHASHEDTIEFKNDFFTAEEKRNIQALSDILKDADALDRNRINYPAPLGGCDETKLRTKEAREVLSKSNTFLKEYNKAIIQEKERTKKEQILNNYEKLDAWIDQYLENKKNGKEDTGYLFHASMDPSIEVLEPKESTQKGAYVYAGIDPVDCFTMAAFRLSLLFRRKREKETNKRQIIDVFPGTINKTLKDKYITIYRLPETTFTEYVRGSTSSPNREWASKESVTPLEEVSFEALDLLNHIVKRGQLNIIENENEALKLESVLPNQTEIWDLKKLKTNPNAIKEKEQMRDAFVSYYAKEYLPIVKDAYHTLYAGIQKYSEDYYKEHQEYPDYSSEDEIHIGILENLLLPEIRNPKKIEEQLKSLKDIHNQKKIY